MRFKCVSSVSIDPAVSFLRNFHWVLLCKCLCIALRRSERLYTTRASCCPLACASVTMKRLSSFGFTPVSTPSSSQSSQSEGPSAGKRMRSSEVPECAVLPEQQAESLQLTQQEAPLVHCPDEGLRRSQSHCVRNDIGTYSTRDVSKMSDNDRLWLLDNAFRPEVTYRYPHKEEYGKKRSFQSSWLNEFPWLCYSESCNGGFCVFCFLFAKHHLPLGQLVTSAMTNFTRAKVTLLEHSKQNIHIGATMDAMEFKSRMEGRAPTVQQLLLDERSSLVKRNRSKIMCILKTIVFCGRQMIPLRGHREQQLSNADTPCNPGNFRALLDFRVDAGDTVLANHFKTAPANAQYNSPQIQNELIVCTGEWIREKILCNVRTAKFFSVCADEAADCSNKEQLPLVLRYVDSEGSICEDFVDFVLCNTGTTGTAIAEKIMEALEMYGLNLGYIRGQGYDGAGNMAGKYRGAAVTIQSRCPKAVYIHCAAHALNLCVVAACSVQLVKNMMGTMVEICLFFSNSPKRQLELEKNIASLDDVTAKKLIGLCKTRWVARIDALELFMDLFPAVVAALESISDVQAGGWNTDSSRLAGSLLHAITAFPFIIAFVVAKQCLAYVKGLTVSLQKRAKDICQAYKEANNVVLALTQLRLNVDEKHKEWFDISAGLCQQFNGSGPQLPRRCSVQTARCNMPGDTPEVYYKRTVSIPFLDELISHLRSRFSTIQEKAIKGMTLVPSVIVESNVTVGHLLEAYRDDLPNPSSLEVELHLWKCKWSSIPTSTNVPDTPAESLKVASYNMFPNIHTIFRLVCTLPVTSCECERSVSVLRRLKTYLRSSMGQERLSGLALMHINYGVQLNFEEIINIFARKHPRRIMLSDIMQ